MNAYHLVSYTGYLWVLVGLGLIGYGGTFFYEIMDLKANGIVVQGQVIDINVKQPYRAPIVRFTTKDGTTHTFLSRLDVNVRWFNYVIGQKVDVIYHKQDYKNCQINAFWELNVGWVFLWTLGPIMILLGIWMRRRYKRKGDQLKERLGI